MYFKNRKLFQMYLLYCIGFVDLFAVGVTVPLIAQHMKVLGTSHFVIGFMSAAYSGCQLFSGPLIGSLSDLKGRKKIFFVSLICCSVAYNLLGVFSSIVLLIGLRVLLGLFKQTQMLTKAMVADVCSSAEQSGVYGKLAAIAGLGITLGPVVGGHIAEDLQPHGFAIACATTSLLFMLNAGLVHFIDKNKEEERKSRNMNVKNQALTMTHLYKTCADSLSMSVKDLLTVDWSTYWDVFLFKAIVSFGMGCYFSSYSMLLKTRYDLSPKWIGYTISFQGVVTAFCSFFIQVISDFYSSDTDYSQRNLHGFILMVISFLGMTFASNYFVFLVCLTPLAVCNATMRQFGLEMIINKSSSRHRGSLIGASNSMRSLAGITAPLVAGYLSDLIDVNSVLYASTIACTLGLVVSACLRLRTYKNTVTTTSKKHQ